MLPKFRIIPFETDYPLRAPHENMERIAYRYERDFNFLNDQTHIQNYEKALLDLDDPGRTEKSFVWSCLTLQGQITALHGIGHPIDVIKDRLLELVNLRRKLSEFHPTIKSGGVSLTNRQEVYAIALFTLPTEELEVFFWANYLGVTKDKERVYVFDVVMSAFRPDFKMAKKYTRNKFAYKWADPLHKALTLKPGNKEAALAQLMEGWVDRMKDFFPPKWKPWEEEQYKTIDDKGNKRYAFPNFDFAYEVALAVCAYDLDDSSFKDHPYYPGDLVNYYRENIRNTRDAWRKPTQGPTVTMEPFKLERTNLAKKKSKGFHRWLDIASNGDSDAVGDVLLRFPSIRKIKNLGEIVQVMGDYGIALTVDLKDDITCEQELKRLISERNILAQYTSPKTKYPAGPGRCQELLEHGETWLAQNGYKLIQLICDGDWDAVVIDQPWADEFNELSQKLGVDL